MKLRSGKIVDIPMEGSSGSGECAVSDESTGLGERKRQRSNDGVCSPGQRESELGGVASRDAKTYEEVRGEYSSRGNCKRHKFNYRGQGSGKGKESEAGGGQTT